MKNNLSKIGIIGLGFVGNAIKESMTSIFEDLVLIDPAKGYNSPYQDLLDCDGVFVCVPSPHREDGSCDTSILEDVLTKLADINYTGVIISKCTAPPNVYEQLNDKYPNLIHAPEFLTAANAVRDYTDGKFSIIGGKVQAYRHEAHRIIKIGQTQLKTTCFCTIGEASLAKYTINSFLATKVVFMNEMARLAELGGHNWNTIRNLINLDAERMGNSHTQVPGPDGQYGFGGACFPKDTSALLKYAESLNAQMNVLDSAVRKNTLLRLTDSK